jgi:hypothetical protein
MATWFFFPPQNLATLGTFYLKKKPFVKITLAFFIFLFGSPSGPNSSQKKYWVEHFDK